jgi:CBS domain-containing protein
VAGVAASRLLVRVSEMPVVSGAQMYRHLPVVDGNDVVGVLSIRDLVQVVVEDSAPRGA